jgi:hypothetical protein
MAFFGYVLIGLFSLLRITGAAALIWSLVFSIRMTFQYQETGVAYSRPTLWNPMNAMLRPSLLSVAGRRSRQLELRGVLVFLAAYAGAGCFALAVKIFG